MEQLERVVPELFRLDACKIPFWNKPAKLKEEEESYPIFLLSLNYIEFSSYSY